MKILFPILTILALTACKSSRSEVGEKAIKPATFKFLTTKSQNPYLVVRNVGDVEIRGSMPDTTVVTIDKKSKAASHKRAAELLDAITFSPTLAKDGKISITPFYPPVSAGEHVRTDVKILVPLNMDFPVNVATRDGKVEIRGIHSTVNLNVTGKAAVFFKVFKGTVKGAVEKGTIRMGDHILGADLKLGTGTLSLSQRERRPGSDITLSVLDGVVNLQLIKGFEAKIDITAPTIENNSGYLKLDGGKGGKGDHTLRIVVKKGKVVIKPELF